MGIAFDDIDGHKIALRAFRSKLIATLKEIAMIDDSQEKRFSTLQETLSERMWMSADGPIDLADMSQRHLENTISVIKNGGVDLLGLEDEFVEMLQEELEDRDAELDFE